MELRLGWALRLALAATAWTSVADAQTISSAANQTFGVGNGNTAISTITVTEDGSPLITAANDLRIRIPAGFNMTWNAGDVTANLAGSAAGKVSTTVTYESGNQVLHLNVTANWAAGDQLIVSGLQFNTFSAASAADNLELVISGSSGGPTVATDDKTKTIVAPTLSSAANQTFVVADPGTAMSAITVTDASVATITAANDIRIRIPTGFNMLWNTGVTTATIGGGAAAKVSTTVTYENAGQVLRLNVSANFVAGDQITVSGLQFTSFTAPSAAQSLELVISGSSGGATVASDDKTKTIVAPTFTETANQVFVVANPATAMTTATITESGTPRITAANDIRIRIPTGFNMTWNTALTTATIGGSAAGKVSTTVTYESGGQVLRLNVSANFVAGDQITVSGLQFANFTAPSAAQSLELVISGAGGATAATSNRTKQIVQPALVSAANQTFTVGDPAVAMSTITVTDASTATITAANDLRIRIPTGFNMIWNTALTSVTIGGGAAAKVSNTVSYENGGQVLVLNVTSNFAASDQITVSGLQFTNFTAVSPANALQLVVSGPGGGTAAIDSRTIQIYAPMAVSSAANQTFGVGNGNTTISTITVTEDGSPSITAANDLRIRIPAGFNMTWNAGDVTANLAGSAAGKVSTTVTYESGNQVLRLNVTADFAAGDQLVVSGLQFRNFTAASAADNLELVVSGSSGGPTVATDDKTKTIVAPTLSSAASQTFVVTDPATAMSAITVTEASVATITAGNDIRIRIPTGFNMTWNTALTTATIGGSAAGKVSTTVTYESGGQVLRLNVSANFAAGDQITVSGLQFTSFTAPSAAQSLELVISGSSGGATVASDDKTKTIVAPAFTEAANQVFAVGDPATAMITATVTDATTPRITAGNDIRLRIPAGFNMTWNTAVTTATIGGAAAGKVSTTVSYESGGQVLVLNVTSNFAASDQITVSGLQFTNFTAVSAAAGLQLVIAGPGGATAATSNQTKQIVAPTVSSAANQTFGVFNPATAMSTITITDASTATITAANDLRIRIPTGFNMTWNTALTTATIGGADAAKVATTVSYEDGGQTLVLDVTANFVASGQITVAGLQFTNFTAVSAADNLELVVSGPGGNTADTDNTTKTIVAPTISSGANQTFAVGQVATAMSTITITDGSTATITAANDIRIRIPAGFNMTWNTGLTTATIGGSAAARVSTTVSYENGGQVLVLNVTSNFTASDQITVSGLQFNTFTAASAAARLELVINGSGGVTAAVDNRTKTIVQPTISSAANQTFTVGQAAAAMSLITVTDAGTATITATNNIRIRIPTGFNMTWNTSVTTATIGGGAAAKVSPTVTYEDAGKTLVLNVTTSFVANDQITATGLQFANFTAPSPAANLELVISGAGGATTATDDKSKTIVAPTLTETANQVFIVGNPPAAMTASAVVDAGTATIAAASDIRIRIPTGLNMTWNTALTTATIGGGASAKVSSTVTYENGGQVLVLNVISDFAANDQVTITGLQFANFTAVSGPAALELVVSGAGGSAAATSDRTKQIVAPTMASAANQAFVIADPATPMSPITITENAAAPGLTAANDLRVRIPASLNMTWNAALLTATIGGGAAGKVSATVAYEDAGKTLVLDVTSDFAASDQITISGLEFDNFTASSPAAGLQLVVSGPGGATAAADLRTKTVVGGTISSAANQTFVVGQAATAMSTITIADAATPATITALDDIRIRIPAGLNMTWNTSLTTATIGGGASGKVSATVSYEDAGKTLVLNVTTDFASSDQITVSGLQFDNFTSVSGADNLELVVSGPGGGASAVDNMTKVIAAPTVSSAANQTFVAGQAAAAMSPITVTDAGTATIAAGNDIRIRIPTGFNLTWNTALTTATIGGGAAAKVSSTVTYENGGQVLVLDVTSDFAASDQIVVSGLEFTNFTAVSAPNYLQLVVSGAAGGTSAADDKTIAITSAGVDISPAGASTSKLPSNGVTYTATGTVQNTGSQTDSYDLLAWERPGTAATLISITGPGVTQAADPDSARLSNLAAGVAASVTLTYSVGDVAAGVIDTIVVIARSTTFPAARDSVKLAVRVVRPSLTFSKAVNPSGTQLPGTDLTYTTTVTNVGTQPAYGVVFVDSLPGLVQFNVGSLLNTFPVPVTVDYSDDGGLTWTYLPASGACGAPASFDGCVNRIRWTLGANLSSSPPNNTGTAEFITRIR